MANKPYHLPRMSQTDPEMDVLAWSMPFLMSKITDMLMNLATKGDKYNAPKALTGETV